MLIKSAEEVTPEVVREGINIRWIITKKDGAPNFACGSLSLHPVWYFSPTPTHTNTKFMCYREQDTLPIPPVMLVKWNPVNSYSFRQMNRTAIEIPAVSH